MSYPGRPPIVQGLAMPPGMAYMPMAGPPQPLMPSVMPIQHMVPIQVTGAPQIRAYPKLNPNREQMKQIQGPAVTVFVGNITEKAPDMMVRHILGTCGPVISWKRVKGFGFCEFGGPEAGLRAVRILHDLIVGEKRLVAKVDAKTKTILDEYKAERRKKEKGSSPLQDEPTDEEDPIDEETQALDALALERIKQVIEEYTEEMNNFELKKEEEVIEKRNKILDEADVEEEKRDLITREIGKFREIMKRQEEEKEVIRRKEKEVRKDRSVTRSPSPRRREKDEKKQRRHTRSRSRDRDRSREKEREREREREQQRERDREREVAVREREVVRERDRDRERERDRDRDRDRERERDDKSLKSTRDLLRDKEIEEETKEKKKAERRAREKEALYQERLRTWETRERRKSKEYEKEREKERIKDEEREREAKRLKEFLEDYDDDRDDVKYYKGRELQKRIADRVKEAESDNRDRLKEKEEIEELKAKIFSGEFEDPNAEFERAKREREEQYKPRLLIDVNLEQWRQKEREKERAIERQHARDRERDWDSDREYDRPRTKEEREKYVVQQAAQELAAVEAEPIDSDSDMDDNHFSPVAPEHNSNVESEPAQWTQVQIDEDSRQSIVSNHHEDPPPPPVTAATMKISLTKPIVFSPHGQRQDPKRKKPDLKDVFNPDEDDGTPQVKKRKLIPLDYDDNKKGKKDKENGEKKSEDSLKSQEEKRKHIKSLIEKIPTEKDALFAYQLDWSAIDNNLMEKKIRPWINKKIIEYIGEPEPTLVDFICSKVLAGSQPQVILEDVQMVLDEEAEVFVVKMWRLLIYEVEAKKLGLVK